MCGRLLRGDRLIATMSKLRSSHRLAGVLLVCLAAGGCSLFRHDSKPATGSPVAAAPAAASAPMAAAMSAPVASMATTWSPMPLHHLDAATMIGQAWSFPSADPLVYRDVRFVFRSGGRVEASNAREHVTGTWSVDQDRLCVTLNSTAAGTACYVVTGSTPAELRIRALPDGERLPLKIQ